MLKICTAKCRCLCFSKDCLWRHSTWVPMASPGFKAQNHPGKLANWRHYFLAENEKSGILLLQASGTWILLCSVVGNSPKEPACMCWPRANEATSWMLACVTRWSSSWGPEWPYLIWVHITHTKLIFSETEKKGESIFTPGSKCFSFKQLSSLEKRGTIILFPWQTKAFSLVDTGYWQ